MEKILITGMAGGLANVVASKISENYEIIGIDPRPYRSEWKYNGKFIQSKYTKRSLAEIFRKYDIDKVLHIGRIADPQEKLYHRYNFNVIGTDNILKLCSKHKTKTVIVLSSFHVYGAHQHNPSNITENYPLKAGRNFPEIIDAVELDHLATSYLWKNRCTRTIILRPCNIVGHHINNTITTFIRRSFMPYLMGFDPLHQFIHETDLANAINMCLENENISGVYNVAGASVIPITEVIRILKAKPVPVPHYLAYPVLGALSIAGIGFPPHLIDYFRYPVVISDEKFRKSTGYCPQKGLLETFKDIT